MILAFIETNNFTDTVYEYFVNDKEYSDFQAYLITNAERGDVIRGCGGLRKIRWRDLRRNKGSRGGLRIIYLWIPEVNIILLLDVYDKDETNDLTSDERRELASMAQQYRDEVCRRNRMGNKNGE